RASAASSAAPSTRSRAPSRGCATVSDTEAQQEEFQAQSPELPEADVGTPRGKGIGQAVLRKEDAEFITGQGRYVDDVKLPGMLHLAFVRSTHAHAKLGNLDASRARSLPGVVDVFTADDLEFQAGVPCGSNPTGDAKQPPRWPLARATVRMVGE